MAEIAKKLNVVLPISFFEKKIMLIIIL